MTLQEYVDSADLLLSATFMTGFLAVIVIFSLLCIAALTTVFYFHTTEYLQRTFGFKSEGDSK